MNSTTYLAPLDTADLVEVDGELYRRHPMGGGLVSITATVANDARVDVNAMVKHRAVVGSGVRLFHDSVVEGSAVVVGMTTLRDRSRVGEEAFVRGAMLRDDAYVGGISRIVGLVSVEQNARLIDLDLSGRYRFS
jgi:carbonic anhydrase/acetyltransferase-like protein (isoleucine patch superfamily)